MEEPTIDLNSKAYYKIMLHCLKHLTSDCCGLLLGKVNGKKYTVTNAIPLTHDTILEPLFKVSISMIKEFCPNETIIGFYENLMVNQMKDDGSFSNTSNYILEMIHKNNKINPLMFQIYSKDSGIKDKGYLVDEILFKEFILIDDELTFINEKKETEEEKRKMKDYCIHNRQQEIIDFDEHLENPNLDWRNNFVE